MARSPDSQVTNIPRGVFGGYRRFKNRARRWISMSDSGEASRVRSSEMSWGTLVDPLTEVGR